MNQQYIEQFNCIYDETYKNTLKFVVLKCGNMEDVFDILQKVYIEVFKYIKKKKIENPRAFVTDIAKKQIYKYYFFKKAVLELPLNEEILDEENDIEDSILNQFDNERIWSFVKEEKIIVQKILVLHHLNGNTFKEIASELNLSENTVKTNYYRALQHLKSKLMKEDDLYE